MGGWTSTSVSWVSAAQVAIWRWFVALWLTALRRRRRNTTAERFVYPPRASISSVLGCIACRRTARRVMSIEILSAAEQPAQTSCRPTTNPQQIEHRKFNMLRVVVCISVCRCACVLCTPVSPPKTAEPIEMPFWGQAQVGPRNQVLDRNTYWRHLANTTKRSVRGSDVSLRQITLTTCCLRYW